MGMHNAPFLFEPDDYFGFFRDHGWRARDLRYLPEEAQKLNRPFPLPRLWRWQLAGVAPGEASLQATALGELAAYLETASSKFYAALEKANSDARRKHKLVVKPGGGNRSELVEDLRAGKYFDYDNGRNNALADLIAEVFRVEMLRRSRKPLTEALMMKLDGLKESAEQLGATWSS